MSSVNGKIETPYNIHSMGIERDDNVNDRCGSSRGIVAWELLEGYSNRIEYFCRNLVDGIRCRW
ncbi:hypothetical protein [Clostridium mucosae]|uniref:hypothetical protein n=1 Tax=Clostridium sp. DSM 100503 TaxID=2963282 RepID=UPI00214A4459|nr:hypothetical protein [Clostridium sp. DSM 100503]